MSFAVRIRKLVSETAIYGISSIVGRLINFILFPFYSYVFSQADYGSASLLYAAFIFLNIGYQYGMESAYLKFASVTPENRKGTFSTASFSLVITSLVFSGLILVFSESFAVLVGLPERWLSLVYFAAGILLLDTLSIVPFAELRLSNRPWLFAAIRGANIVVNVTLNLVLILGFGMGIEAIFIANLAASGVSLVLLIPIYFRLFRFSFDSVLWKKLLRFGLPFVPGGLGYALAERVNILFLSRMEPETVIERYSDIVDFSSVDPATPGVYTETIVGIFSGVTKLAVLLALVVQMFRYAWQPFFLNHAEDDDAPQLFGRVFTLFVASILFVFLGISFFVDDLVAINLPGDYTLINENYWVGLFVVPILMLGYVFQGLYYNFSAGAYILHKTGYFVYCALAGGTVSLLLNSLFVPEYGMTAAAWATASAYGVMALTLFLLIRKQYTVPYDWARSCGAAVLAAACYYCWSVFDQLQGVIPEALLIVAYLAGIALLGIVRPGNLINVLRSSN
ncbi:MAG: polysaccharide biosynthesis protein [Rhodothermales bacterium]|nr:polysaccharide biosynthesis protein [Rhodothermales bacterium]